MTKFGLCLTLSICWFNLAGQTPDASISFDLNPQITTGADGSLRARLYEDTGEVSRIRLNLFFDRGVFLRFFQKLERIPNDGDRSGVDELFLERPGEWKIGKQYVTFGTNRLMNESVVAATVEVFLEIADLPLTASVLDAGEGRQSGVVVRVGDSIGVSYAFGEHFGINSTSFTILRRPEDALGFGRGYRSAFGADISLAKAGWHFSFEWVSLRQGHTSADRRDDIGYAYVSYQFPYGPLLEGEIANSKVAEGLSWRVGSQIPVVKNVFAVPSVRYRKGTGWVVGLSARIRL